MKKYLKVLLIEDDDIFNFIHNNLLLKFEKVKKVEFANNGREALKHFDRPYIDIPEVIFLDLDMPLMNGFDFIDEIKRNHHHVLELSRIYVLTSSISKKDYEKCQEYGLSGYLIKPLTVEDLKVIFDHIE